jgi:hypothetical protein
MAPDGCAVDAVARVVCHRLGQAHHDHLPDACVSPAAEALVHCHPISVFLWHFTPRGSCPYPPENAVDDGLIMRCREAFPASLGRQESLQYAPFRFAQIHSSKVTARLPPPQRGFLNQGSIQASRTL